MDAIAVARVALVRSQDTPDEAVAPLHRLLEGQGLAWERLEDVSHETLSPYDLAVVVGWPPEDHGFYFALKVYYYKGGRILASDWTEDFWSKGLLTWLWGDAATPESEDLLATDDGRALYVPTASLSAAATDLLDALARLCRSTLSVPEAVNVRGYDEPKSTWEVRGESFYLKGEPALLRGIGTLPIGGKEPAASVDRQLAAYRDAGLNFVLPYSAYDADLGAFERNLDAIRRHGLKAVVWIGGPPGHFLPGVAAYSEKPLRDDWWLRHLAYRNHPALLGWNLCDDTFDRYHVFLERTHRLVRSHDPTNVVTITMMDMRWPDRLSREAYRKWIDMVDFPMTYLYPLQKDDVFGSVDIEGGFEDLQRLADNTRHAWGRPVYFQTWCQAHMQGFSYERVGLGPRETFVPTAEQQRLMTWYILQAGSRGIVYFNANSVRDDDLGMGRRNEIGLVWHELAPVERTIAGGTRCPLATGRADVEAVAYSCVDEVVILVSLHHPGSNRYVRPNLTRNVELVLPADLADGLSFFHLDCPAVRPLVAAPSPDGLRLRLDDVDLTALVLGTRHPDRASQVESHFCAVIPRLARMGLDVLVDRRAKTDVVLRHLPRDLTSTIGLALEAADRQYDLAVSDARQGRHPDAHRMARAALRAYRAVQAAIMDAVGPAYRDPDQPLDLRRCLSIFHSTPAYFSRLGQVGPVTSGQLRTEVLELTDHLCASARDRLCLGVG